MRRIYDYRRIINMEETPTAPTMATRIPNIPNIPKRDNSVRLTKANREMLNLLSPLFLIPDATLMNAALKIGLTALCKQYKDKLDNTAQLAQLVKGADEI